MAKGTEQQNRLRRNIARYHRVAHILTDYVYTVWVREGSVIATEHGDACKTITGYTADEFESDPGLWLSMVVPEDRQAVLVQAAMVISGKGSPALEHRIRCKDGALRWIRNTPVPHYDQAGILRCYDGVIQDITVRKRLEDESFQLQKMEALSHLSSGLAHDFNNILTMVIGFNSLVLDGLKPNDTLRSYVKEIDRSAWLASSVTRQMLLLSRKEVARPRFVDINSLLIEMGRLVERLLPSDVEAVLKLSPSVWAIKADITQMQQVLLNLIINARDAMPKGGRLTLLTRNLTAREGERPDPGIALPKGHYVCLEVRDTGIGMDKSVQARLFQPFFTTKEPGRGTGLGLSMIRTIVQHCQGSIAVESAPGKGTTFRIYIPRAEGMAAAVLPAKESPAPVGGRETILLVEDHADLGRLVCRILRSKGYRVLRAAWASEAVALSKKHGAAVDLLLTDIILPDISGGELAAKITAKRPEMRVLYMSGHADAALTEMDKAPGCGLLEKPFSPAQLLQAVRAALDADRIPSSAS
ncbi:MAG: ATP-binding protein [Elusimicrobiota bacterium]